MAISVDRLATIQARFQDVVGSEFRGQLRVTVPRQSLSALASWLKGSGLFEMLVDITCVDYLQYRDARQRFGLVYLLCHTESAERITLRVYLDDDHPSVDSLVPLWESANWLEREVWDMFGIHFTGHPDLRRILLPEAFAAYPLRKDYPLQGRGERHNFPVITRGEA